MNNLILPRCIETERSFIRAVQPGDGNLIYEAVMESYEQFKIWLPWVNFNYTLQNCEDSSRDTYEKFLLNEDFRALIFLKENNKLVGATGLHNIKWDIGQFEVGYWGRVSLQGRGLITEAVGALIDYVVNNYHAKRIFLTTGEQNFASQRVAERVGFLYEGTLHNDRLNAFGKLRNTKIYAIWSV